MDASGIARRPSAVTSNTVPETVELRGVVEDAGDATVGDVLPQATANTDSERAVITPRHIRPPQKKPIDSIGSTRGSSAETGSMRLTRSASQTGRPLECYEPTRLVASPTGFVRRWKPVAEGWAAIEVTGAAA